MTRPFDEKSIEHIAGWRPEERLTRKSEEYYCRLRNMGERGIRKYLSIFYGNPLRKILGELQIDELIDTSTTSKYQMARSALRNAT